MKKTLLITIALIVSAIQLNAQFTIYVDKDATGNNDGSSWADAYNNLDTALIYETNSLNTFWVAEGIYIPGEGGAVNRNKKFVLKGNMYGGFDGTETLLSERDPKTNLTILSGDLLGNDNGVLTMNEPTRADNVLSIIFTSSGSTVDGVIFEGGHANLNVGGEGSKSGAAIFSYNNGMTIRNCVFRNNYGREDGAIVKFRGPTNTNSWFNLHSNEFYNNASLRSMISSTRPSVLTNWCYMNIYNNLFHHNEVTASNASIVCATNHINGGSLSMGDYEYRIYHNTFVNNIIPSTGGTIGHGRNDINGNNDGWGDLNIEVVGNIIWDDAPTLVEYSIVSGSIDNSNLFYFAQNVVKGTDTIQNADLKSDVPVVGGNVYDEYPMFEDTATNDFRILDCTASGNDIVNYINPSLTITTDFYGNPREVGFSKDAGHCEVQDESAAVDLEQVGATIEVTNSFATFKWYYFGDPSNPVLLSDVTSTITPTNGDGNYLVLVEDANGCKNSGIYNFCGSKTVSITLVGDSLVATGTGTASVYTWYFNGSYVGSGESYTPNSPGIYKVNFFEPDGMGGTIGCTASASFEVTCNSLPTAIIIQTGNTLEVNDDYNTYQWYLDGVSITGANSAIHSPSTDGDYEVEVVGVYNCGTVSNTFSYCSSVNVSISQNALTLEATAGFVTYQWFLEGGSGTGITGATSATFSPTQDGTYYCNASDGTCTGSSNSINFSMTSISTYKENLNLTIYPNPTNGFINIKTDLEINKIEVFNMNGQIVNQVQLSNKVDLTNTPNGVYIVKVTTNEGVSVNRILKN